MRPTLQAALERHQVWLYLAAIGLGLVVAARWPAMQAPFEAALWPVLALLLYATFAQIPLLHVREAFADGRFMAANLLGHFVAIPLALALALPLFPAIAADPALRLGVVLVLVVPCTDWFITFTALGRGDPARALAVTPLNLVLQLLLLPVYLWLLVPEGDLGRAFSLAALMPPALALIGLPLVAAALTERWIEAAPARSLWRERLALWPVPLLAGVVFLIAGAQAAAVRDAGPVLVAATPLFAGFLIASLALAITLARAFRLGEAAGRTLAFGFGTRNSFVVLPLVLALPAGWEATVVVIVYQSLVELLGMVLWLGLVPRLRFARR
jgi:ACR3 family arsenite efflux pump ArsB